ncbi:MAG: molybdenum cofactor guanylyltransferase [Pirellulales bacterium]|nr:molybdenum cofactor guanylyltransferase [Pirellulales bacterium]
MRCAGLIVCGGESRRMGRPKALLPFGPECMLQRVVRLLGSVARPLVVVAARGQELPELAEDIRVVRDRHAGRGPLEGLAVGMAALAGEVEIAYATSCDVPLLVPAVVQRLVELVEGYDVVVPRTEGFYHPLAAVYRTGVLPEIEALLAADRLRPVYLFERVRVREVAPQELIDLDPTLATLRNLNDPQDYQRALEEAGLDG